MFNCKDCQWKDKSKVNQIEGLQIKNITKSIVFIASDNTNLKIVNSCDIVLLI